jgi:hypothetical protein
LDFAHKSFSVLFLFFINENYDQDYQTIDAQLEHQFPLGRLSVQARGGESRERDEKR